MSVKLLWPEKAERKNLKDKMEKVKRFTDIYPSEVSFEAEAVDFKSVFDKDLKILDVANLIGSYGSFIIILAEDDGKRIQFNTGSDVIMQKLKIAKDENQLPLIAKFIERTSADKKNKYYDIA